MTGRQICRANLWKTSGKCRADLIWCVCYATKVLWESVSTEDFFVFLQITGTLRLKRMHCGLIIVGMSCLAAWWDIWERNMSWTTRPWACGSELVQLQTYSSSRMRVMTHNWSATKQHLHADICAYDSRSTWICAHWTQIQALWI